ncbi:glycosyltransferase family 4 protein [Cryobacterium sp. Y82]|uniref:glycosyltransferase family 4 protein n=1 Tax=Cryobacterium sp. Y82 TaxID=2045017 RepID=UPI000CE4631D|nr:glycosyltransferase family 4 protein [Cryobacterium sp. Y82]
MNNRTIRKNVVFLHSSNEMYGADRMLLEVINALPPYLHAIVLIPNDIAPSGPSLSAELETRGIQYEVSDIAILRRAYLRPAMIPQLLYRTLKTVLAIKRLDPEIVYLTTSSSLITAPALRVLGRRKVIFHCQEIWSGREARLLGILARGVTKCICISNPAFSALRGKVTEKAVVIENGHRDAREPTTNIAGHRGAIKFLIASRWNAWKGHGTLLDAWEEADSPGELIIAGGPPPVGKSFDVPTRVLQLSNPRSVRIVGEVSNIRELLDGCDFLIVPSDDPEPFGLVAIEAFSRKRPVIGSRGGGLATIISDGRDGFLYSPKSSIDLAEILGRVSRTDAISAGRIARQTYEKRYSISVFTTAMTAVFESVAPNTHTQS